MKIVLLNQFGGHSGAPTGRLAEELAAFLRERGHEAVVAASDFSYTVKRRGWRRWAHELKSHVVLFFKALAHGRGGAILALTSPVCLPVTAALAARAGGAKLYLWNMDLYPDLALALGELKPGSLASFLRHAMIEAYRSAARVVALDEDMRTYLRENYGVESEIVSPWPPDLRWPDPESVSAKRSKLWLYSGNLGQAHDIQTLLEVQCRLEKEGSPAQLVLQGAGAQWVSSQQLAAKLGLKNVIWRVPVDESELTSSLRQAGVLVVTRKPGMKGLIWPSKLALAQLSGRPILWIGDTDSATARSLAQGENGVFRPEQKEEVAAWLNQTLGDGARNEPGPISPEISRRDQMERWSAILDRHAKPGA